MIFRSLLWRMSGLAVLALFLAQLCAAVELTKDDIEFRKYLYTKKKGEQLPYRLYVPLGYSSDRKYPLVLWLHGGEGRGSDNVRQISKGNEKGSHLWTTREAQNKLPAFVLAPQCPSGENWADPDLNEPALPLQLTMDVLAKVESEFSIDPDRVFIVGQSMGGLGVWSLLQTYPAKWAGAVVLAAYDNFTNPMAISRTPLWVFQGDADQTVPVDLIREMMKQLKRVQANLRYTEYHKVDHNVWDNAFAEPELIPWLASQRRGQTAPSQVGSGVTP
jgi:predicted peptidase